MFENSFNRIIFEGMRNNFYGLLKKKIPPEKLFRNVQRKSIQRYAIIQYKILVCTGNYFKHITAFKYIGKFSKMKIFAFKSFGFNQFFCFLR